MRGVFGLRRSLVAVFAAVAIAVPVFIVATALPAGAVDVGDATNLASNFNDPNVTSITMTADISIDCGHLLDRTSGNDLTLDGGGHTLTQSCANSRVMIGAGAGALTLSNITITGGHTTFTDDGGGVLWNDDVTITNGHVTGNTAAGNGGGIYTAGALVATGSTFTSNTAEDSGGGAYAENGIVAIDSTFTNNSAGGRDGCTCSGGGFYTEGSAFAARTNFLDNAAGDCSGCTGSGGGFFSEGIAVVNASTFTTNRAGEECESCGASGGGFYSLDDTTITDSHFDLNSAGNCGNCGAEGGGFFANADTSATSSTFTQNFARDCGSCGGDGGGATVFDGTFTITNSVFSENSVACGLACNAFGGGASIFGGAVITASVFQNNNVRCGESCAGQGGGIFVSGPLVNQEQRGSHQIGDISAQAEGFGTLSVSHSAFTGNAATCLTTDCEAGGGGIVADHVDPVTIDHSTLSGNSTIGVGGALIVRFGGVAATITNSTITGNASGSLGAVVSFGSESTLTLVYDTIVANVLEAPTFPDSVEGRAAVDSANVHVDSALVSVATVIALPKGGTNCSKANGGTQTSQGYNFSDDLTCGFTNAATGDRQGAGLPPVGLGPLSDNGGIGQTMLPQGESPLLEAIPSSACQTGAAAGVTDDERGVPRPQGFGCEIGAVEVLMSIDPAGPKFTG